jgi:predicted nucleic acid-binding protein
VIVADTSGLLAAFGKDARQHAAARAAIESDRGPVIISPFVLAELDYMLLERAGADAEQQFLREVAAGVFELTNFSKADVALAVRVIDKYRDLKIGLADASIVVLAERYGTTRLLSLDERNFRVVRPLHAAVFTLLPADA